jgi:formylglycine-generating enzyme required for sulfatase activity
VNQAVAAARSREEQAGGDPEQVEEVVEAWAAAGRLYEKRADTLGELKVRSGTRLCAVAQARLYHQAATSLERADPPRSLVFAQRAAERYAPLKADDPEAAAKLKLVTALLTRLERVKKKPEGMILVAGRRDVELGSGARDHNPPRRVSIKPFYLAKREVTNREYAAFVVSKEYGDDAFWRRLGADRKAILSRPSGWSGSRPPEGREDLPVAGISWNEARGYATYMGMRLPTDREWEYAARYGAGEVFEFPWGATFESGSLSAALRPSGSNTSDVTPSGLSDMGGNVSEWVTRSEGPTGKPTASARGASYLYPTQRIARGVHRLTPRAGYRGPQLGLRLAKGSQ